MPTAHTRLAVFAVIALVLAVPGCSPSSVPSSGDERGDEVLVEEGVPYAGASSTARTELDVYWKDDGATRPVVLFVHGGGWSIGDKTNHDAEGRAFAEEGFVWVNVNYRLSPDVQHPVHAQDVAAAVGWVHEHAANYGGDPRRLFLVGHSAGAHLAALVSTDASFLRAEGLETGDISGTVLLDSKLYDLIDAAESGWIRRRMIQRAIGTAPARWRAASPLHQIGATPGPVFLLFSASRRTLASTRDFARALRTAGHEAEVVPVLNETHMSISNALSEPGSEVMEATLAFMRAERSHAPPTTPRRSGAD